MKLIYLFLKDETHLPLADFKGWLVQQASPWRWPVGATKEGWRIGWDEGISTVAELHVGKNGLWPPLIQMKSYKCMQNWNLESPSRVHPLTQSSSHAKNCRRMQRRGDGRETARASSCPCHPICGPHCLPLVGLRSWPRDELDSSCRNPPISFSLWSVQSLMPPTKDMLLPPQVLG